MLKFKYDKQEDIPEKYRDLYTEQDGVWVFSGVEGMKGQDDVDRVQEALRKEREDHKSTKDKLAKFGELDPDKVHEALDEVDELRAKVEAGGGEPDNNKLEELVESRVKRRLAPVERERDRLKSQLEETSATAEELQTRITQSTIQTALREQATKAKVTDTAVDDILLYGERVFEVGDDGKVTTRDNVGVTPGLTPEAWLSDMKKARPHWWPVSTGAGARGSNGGGQFGDNPWSAEAWNLTKQGEVIRSQGADRAEEMARAANSRVGATAPTPVKQSA